MDVEVLLKQSFLKEVREMKKPGWLRADVLLAVTAFIVSVASLIMALT